MTPNHRQLLPVLVLAVLASAACMPPEEDAADGAADTVRMDIAPAPGDEAAMREGVDATNRAAEAAVGAGDVAGFVQRVYTDDAVILPPDAPRISGHGDIEAFWSSAAEQLGLTGIRLETEELHSMGPDMAYEIGTGHLETPQGTMAAKYVVIWERGADDVWRWHVDIWNSAPAPAGDG